MVRGGGVSDVRKPLFYFTAGVRGACRLLKRRSHDLSDGVVTTYLMVLKGGKFIFRLVYGTYTVAVVKAHICVISLARLLFKRL